MSEVVEKPVIYKKEAADLDVMYNQLLDLKESFDSVVSVNPITAASMGAVCNRLKSAADTMGTLLSVLYGQEKIEIGEMEQESSMEPDDV